MKSKLLWSKLPSVTRERKYFFVSRLGNQRVSVTQGFYTNKWHVQFDENPLSEGFDTAGDAMNAVEKM